MIMFQKINQFYSIICSLGVDPRDTPEQKTKKITITTVPLIMATVGLIWAAILFAYNQYLSATLPFVYTVISVLNLYIFSLTKKIETIQKIQMLFVLIIPFLLMWSLGGFVNGAYMMVWAFFSPIIALMHHDKSKSFYWLGTFLALILLSYLIDPYLIALKKELLPDNIIALFAILNLSLSMSGFYFLLRYFINERERDTQATIGDNLSYLQSYKNTIDTSLIVTRTDTKGVITFANQNFYNISGFTKDEVIGKTHNILRHPDNSNSFFAKMWQTILAKKTWHGQFKNLSKGGQTYWVDSTIAPILNNNGDIVEFIAIRHDITQLIDQQEKLKYMLYFDALTNLYNRNALLRDLQKNKNYSLVLFNIDHFSHINDLYGETFGDKVLQEFATLFQKAIHGHKHATLYRLGGDEFALLVENEHTLEVLSMTLEILNHIHTTNIVVEKHNIVLVLSAGISYEENILLLSTANMALKMARRINKHHFIYTKVDSLNDEYENNMHWIKEIQDAIDEDRIEPFFQPIVDNKTNATKKYEALIRLIDRNGNIISPAHFLEIAKKAKLYKKLTKIMIHKTLTLFENTQNEVSLNLTIDDILDIEIRTFILDKLQKSPITKQIIFEIVESESIDNFDEIESFIHEVKAFGCRIAIDDFGTGYSNFEHLMRLQADFIKIDGSIIKEVIHDKRSELITSIIVAFAKEMKIETIGEFVENKEIHEKLIELGVNRSQGYYFSKPQPHLPII